MLFHPALCFPSSSICPLVISTQGQLASWSDRLHTCSPLFCLFQLERISNLWKSLSVQMWRAKFALSYHLAAPLEKFKPLLVNGTLKDCIHAYHEQATEKAFSFVQLPYRKKFYSDVFFWKYHSLTCQLPATAFARDSSWTAIVQSLSNTQQVHQASSFTASLSTVHVVITYSITYSHVF